MFRSQAQKPPALILVLTPMIDVVFLLLVYALVCITHHPREVMLGQNLPALGRSVFEPAEWIRIRLQIQDRRCLCSINDRPAGVVPGAKKAIYRKIRGLLRESPRRPAHICAGPRVRHQLVVNVMDECIRAGVEDILFTLPASMAPKKKVNRARGPAAQRRR